MTQPNYAHLNVLPALKKKVKLFYPLPHNYRFLKTRYLRCFNFLLISLIAITNVKSQSSSANWASELPATLKGEWYHPATGSCTFGFYDRGAVFEGRFWQYDSLQKSKKSIHLYLTSEYGQKAVLECSLSNDKLKLSTSSEKNLPKVSYFRFREQCSIKHNLPAIARPGFSKDTVYFNYYSQNAVGGQISVGVKSLILSIGTNYYLQIQNNGMVHVAIPVKRPTLLEVTLSSTYNKEPVKIMMVPGSEITLLETNGQLHYGGAGSLLALEMQPLFEKQHYGSGLDILSLIKGKLQANQKPTPAQYKQQFLTIREDLLKHLDSVKSAGQISPLSYQIGRYNIIYAVADALLHYTEKTKDGWYAENSEHTNDVNSINAALPSDYFDFLKGLDNDEAIISPAFRDFVESIRNPNQHTDYPPLDNIGMDTIGHIAPQTLAKDLLPLQHLDPPLTASQRQLLQDVLNLTDSAAIQKFVSQHQQEFITLSTDYYLIYILDTVPNFLLARCRQQFGWKPGILTDILAPGNLTQQFLSQGQTGIPEEYFKGPNQKFSNPFIAATLLERLQEIKNTSTQISAAQAMQTNQHAINYNSEAEWMDIHPEQFISCDTIRRNGLTLIFAINQIGFSQQIKDSMIKTFFAVYPKQMQAYNKEAAKKVIFVMDSACPLLAATVHNVVRFQPKWFNTNPKDYDVVTHEVMHIIQHYQKNNYSPRWLSEGIADYVRQIYGLHNVDANWSMPPLINGMHYTNSYRITARFLYWITEHKDKDFVRVVDKMLRDDSYSSAVWQERTGKELDQLWSAYTENPQIDLQQLHSY